jgi:ParB-like chromosome segregation protein Spo0J
MVLASKFSRKKDLVYMDFHEAANIFPMMSEDGIDSLAADIEANGLQCPVEVFQGKIIDGRNRWMACMRVGVTAKTVHVNPPDPIAYVLSLNLHRRHLDITQQSMVGGRARALYDKQAKERQKVRVGNQPGAEVENLPQLDKGKARDMAGKAVGVSGRSIDLATKVLKNGSKELIDACDRGEVAVSAAAKLTELPKAKQNEIIKSAVENNQALKKVVSKAARNVVPNPDSDWTKTEIDRRKVAEAGGTVVANKRSDRNLLRWASENNRLLPIDRGTQWGNPFVMDADGTRDEVCDHYDWYLDYKPSLLSKLDSLRGKVLACWCYPERCHGDCLCERMRNDS